MTIMHVFVILLVVAPKINAVSGPRLKACVEKCKKDVAICKRFIRIEDEQIESKKVIQCMVAYYNCLGECTRLYCPSKYNQLDVVTVYS